MPTSTTREKFITLAQVRAFRAPYHGTMARSIYSSLYHIRKQVRKLAGFAASDDTMLARGADEFPFPAAKRRS